MSNRQGVVSECDPSDPGPLMRFQYACGDILRRVYLLSRTSCFRRAPLVARISRAPR
jgi:hypothetical protein